MQRRCFNGLLVPRGPHPRSFIPRQRRRLRLLCVVSAQQRSCACMHDNRLRATPHARWRCRHPPSGRQSRKAAQQTAAHQAAALLSRPRAQNLAPCVTYTSTIVACLLDSHCFPGRPSVCLTDRATVRPSTARPGPAGRLLYFLRRNFRPCLPSVCSFGYGGPGGAGWEGDGSDEYGPGAQMCADTCAALRQARQQREAL